MATFHANGNDGKAHVHGCDVHPTGSAAGGSACFWTEHDLAWRALHLPEMRAGLAAQIAVESNATMRVRVDLTLRRM